ncbi:MULTISPECIES: helix-turn-helix domain-containing protein [unclassified Hyphomonas]|jgi:transcriptional regulator with XRE-family HTH domain|uniref:helix-turn-helix domain-containing protein n=1 Tax=unclassified Hyphomonas TaxID=2630699 RepID=UPI0025C6179E|nr:MULTISPECIES: helix-turn-helix transcriptional regulator [unclassified Hyphomonas]|tara:strand:- start:5827 stop:6129 length:303 start_codon:yes stop_codon:yes gene_type:complete
MGLSTIGITRATGFVRGAVVNKTLRTPAHRKLVQELRTARREAGLSQQQVAELLGVPQSYVAKIELGERRIDVIEFLQLVAAIDASWLEILGRVDSADKP